jgi:hypothetical protein
MKNIGVFEMALTQFCLHVLHIWEDDDVPLFSKETFKLYAAAARLTATATATVQADTGMSDDDNDVTLFNETHIKNHIKYNTCQMTGCYITPLG